MLRQKKYELAVVFCGIGIERLALNADKYLAYIYRFFFIAFILALFLLLLLFRGLFFLVLFLVLIVRLLRCFLDGIKPF